MNRSASLRGFFEEEFLPGGLTEPMTIPLISAKTLWRLRAESRRWRSLTSTWMSSKKRMWHFQLNLGGGAAVLDLVPVDERQKIPEIALADLEGGEVDDGDAAGMVDLVEEKGEIGESDEQGAMKPIFS
jgi:hypothetical protein